MTRHCAWQFSTEKEQIDAYEDFVFKMATNKIKVHGSVYRLMTIHQDKWTYIVACVVDDRDSHRKVKRHKPSGSMPIDLDETIVEILAGNRRKNAPSEPNSTIRIKHTV